MAEKHPNELELLSFVEEELGEATRHDVAEHLVGCRTCTDQVRRLEAGRTALRSAAPLELPEERRDAILASLPDRPDPWRRFRPVKRGLLIAAPVAAAAALAVVFVVGDPQSGVGDDDVSADQAAEARDDAGGADAATGPVQMEAAPATEQDAPTDAPEGTTFVQFAQGPPAEIVRLLAGEGIQAEVEPGGGVIAEARPGEVRAALEGRATGDVPVYVR